MITISYTIKDEVAPVYHLFRPCILLRQVRRSRRTWGVASNRAHMQQRGFAVIITLIIKRNPSQCLVISAHSQFLGQFSLPTSLAFHRNRSPRQLHVTATRLRGIFGRDAYKSLSRLLARGAWPALFSTASTWMGRSRAAFIFRCMDTREGPMSSVSASNVQTFPTTLPAAGQAAGHAISITFVAVIALCSMCRHLCELHRHGLASSDVAGWAGCRLVRGRRGVVRSWNRKNDVMRCRENILHGGAAGSSIATRRIVPLLGGLDGCVWCMGHVKCPY